MKNFKKYLSYILIFLGLIIGIKTIPSAIHHFLYLLNIENRISLDLTSCETIAFSIIGSHFLYALFLFAFLCLCIGLLLLFRKQKITIQYNYYNFGFLLIFILFFVQSLSTIVYIYLLMLEDNLFNTHIIYTFAFIIACLTNILFLILFLLIWFDTQIGNIAKIICFIILGLFSLQICFKMLTFIDLYGINDVEASDWSPTVYFGAFDYVLTNLGISALCMDENPCKELFRQMQGKCDHARDAKTLPRIHNVGGPASLRWIARLMNTLGTTYKTTTQQDCNEARSKYNKCIDFFYSENNKGK